MNVSAFFDSEGYPRIQVYLLYNYLMAMYVVVRKLRYLQGNFGSLRSRFTLLLVGCSGLGSARRRLILENEYSLTNEWTSTDKSAEDP